MRRKYWILVIIILLAAFLRLWDLKNIPPGLWSDEAMNGVNTIQANEGGGWKVFYPENFGREGLFINIQALFVKALGHEPWVLRLPSAIFGILTVLGLYLMTKELFFGRVAVFSAFFMATSFWHINFSRIGFRAIMAPFFLVWGFYFLFLAMRKALIEMPKAQVLQDLAQRDGASRAILQQENMRVLAKSGAEAIWARPDVLIVIAGFIFGLGVHSYIAYRVAPLIVLYPLWIFYKNYRAGKLKESACAPCLIALFIFMALVAASPLLIYFAQNPADFFGRTSSISIFSSPNPLAQFSENTVKTLQMFNFFGDFNWRHNFRGASQLWWPVGILFLLGIISSLRPYFSRLTLSSGAPTRIQNPVGARFILFWFFIMMLPVAMSSEGLPHALRSIVLLPPAMIFASLGLEAVIGKTKHRLEQWKERFPAKLFQINRIEQELKILLAIFLLSVTVNAFNQYFMRWVGEANVYDSFLGNETKIAHWLNDAPKNVKKYVVTDSIDTIDLTGRPLSFMPVIFITNTYFDSKQKEKNIYYLGKNEFDKIDCPTHCAIIPVESGPTIYTIIRQKVPGLIMSASNGFVVLTK
ncbi:MAG: glycosyltransferase family 39 protein [bacterium]|nr:glycosyltransferase family 39 protein [bacterium]